MILCMASCTDKSAARQKSEPSHVFMKRFSFHTLLLASKMSYELFPNPFAVTHTNLPESYMNQTKLSTMPCMPWTMIFEKSSSCKEARRPQKEQQNPVCKFFHLWIRIFCKGLVPPNLLDARSRSSPQSSRCPEDPIRPQPTCEPG